MKVIDLARTLAGCFFTVAQAEAARLKLHEKVRDQTQIRASQPLKPNPGLDDYWPVVTPESLKSDR